MAKISEEIIAIQTKRIKELEIALAKTERMWRIEKKEVKRLKRQPEHIGIVKMEPIY